MADGGVAVSFTATIEADPAAALDRWDRMDGAGDALAFQRRPWLSAWFGTMGRRAELDLLPVTIRDAAGAMIAGLPLVRETRGLRRIGFADGGLVDYNAPILGSTAPIDTAGAMLLWRALLRVLPAADVVRLERMPHHVGTRPNPLALLPAARRASTLGLAVTLADGYAGWLAALPRRYRMELGRCARLFEALPHARFGQVAAPEISGVLDALDALQRSRIDALALPYGLDDADARAFHHRLGSGGEAGVLFALHAEGRLVAALFGLRVEDGFTMLRVAAEPDYARLSPARLVITRSMERLAGEGVRTIDLGLGDYPYKRRLGGVPVDLVDVVAARSLRGLAEVAEHRGRAALRGRPLVRAAARRLRATLRLPRFRPTGSA